MWEPWRLTTIWASTARTGIALTFLLDSKNTMFQFTVVSCIGVCILWLKHNLNQINWFIGTRTIAMVLSALQLPTGWTTDGSDFESLQGKGFSLLHKVQTSYVVHLTSFPGGKAAGAWSWPLTSKYCRGQENMYLYIHSPIRLHGIVLK
jgi:hypothetical protein